VLVECPANAFFKRFRFWFSYTMEQTSKPKPNIVPFVVFGRIANSLLVRSRLKDIFDFREKVINQIFNTYRVLE